MSNEISHLLRRESCPRCLESVSRNQPVCGGCDSWLPWGHDAVAINLSDLRERHNQEYARTERHWRAEAVRLDAPVISEVVAVKPRRFAFTWPLATAAFAALLCVALLFARPIFSSASTRAVAVAERTGAICRDGSETKATGAGACSGHDGVSRWVH